MTPRTPDDPPDDQGDARDAAIEKVAQRDKGIQFIFLIGCQRVACRLDHFTMNDVWVEIASHFRNVEVREGRVMGAVMQNSARNGYSEPTHETRIPRNPIRPNHKRKQTLHRSLICGQNPLPWPARQPRCDQCQRPLTSIKTTSPGVVDGICKVHGQKRALVNG